MATWLVNEGINENKYQYCNFNQFFVYIYPILPDIYIVGTFSIFHLTHAINTRLG